jgi:hypothetical protein
MLCPTHIGSFGPIATKFCDALKRRLAPKATDFRAGSPHWFANLEYYLKVGEAQ